MQSSDIPPEMLDADLHACETPTDSARQTSRSASQWERADGDFSQKKRKCHGHARGQALTDVAKRYSKPPTCIDSTRALFSQTGKKLLSPSNREV
jgi:hypothetical protein